MCRTVRQYQPQEFTPKTEKTYVDANGYIQYGDKPDEALTSNTMKKFAMH